MTARTRERVVDSRGQERVQKHRPRVDVLYYPAHELTTVLVRRTHNIAVARALAEERWQELTDQHLVDAPLGTEDRCVRVGWWTTTAGRQRTRDQAIDHHGRLVTACLDTDHAAGPGVEFRP